MSKKLTKTVVDSLTPEAKDVFAWDAELQGFGVRVQPSGRKTYLVRYRTKDANRTQRKLNIARCSDMPPEKARELARKIFAQVAEGQDPVAERKPVKTTQPTVTVEKMFQGYVASMRSKGRVSAHDVERALLYASNNAADSLGRTRHPAEITAMDVVNHVSELFKEGHRNSADKHRSYICSAYTWAMKSANDYTAQHRQNWGIDRNPAADVAKDPEAVGTRDRNLSAEEIKLLWDATEFDGFNIEIGCCIRLLICCGQRVQETLRLEGSEIDFEKAIWTMPAHKTKSRKYPHIIPLPRQAIPVLKILTTLHGNGMLFPGRWGDSLLDHRSVNYAISRWLKTVDVPHFQSRDLRRTFKSRTHDAGIDRFTRDLLQQHITGNVVSSKHYDRAEYVKQKQEAMQKWSDYLDVVIQ